MPRSNEGGVGPPLAAAGRSLDWLNLFVANIQTGFGPFIAVYLTTQGWTQTAIGIALSLGTVTAMASQVPGGALVDAVPSKSRVAFWSIGVFTVSALLFAATPLPLFVYLAEMLHGFSSCTLSPAIVAMSVGLVGRAALGLRLGRNARFSSIGNGLGAVLMGACGYYVSERAVFLLTAALTLPALLVLAPLSGIGDRPLVHYGDKPRRDDQGALRAALDPRLLLFAGCAGLFTFANAAMLPLIAGYFTKHTPTTASLLIAVAIVLPQTVVALLSPRLGLLAQSHGRRPVVLLGFLMLPLRGLLFATLTEPMALLSVQLLDGVAAACFGVMTPLVTTDIAGRSGHLNLALGMIGFAIGVGATLSTTVAGALADSLGNPAAFLALGAIGAAGTLLVAAALPETRPTDEANGASR